MPNEYDNEAFFARYAQMDRSKGGLTAAGEWYQLKPLFPPLEGMAVMDLGCGYGWRLHYIEDLEQVFQNVWRTLRPSGIFLFNIEHPVFTSGVYQDWICGGDGMPKYWPVDDYYRPGRRVTRFLGCGVIKQHHTLTQILMGLLNCGFTLEVVEEVQPSKEMLEMPSMKDELRRPMMLLVRAKKETAEAN